MENTLTVKNLCKKFKGFTLDNISLEVPRGYIMGLIGPNGAGKTTTLRLVMNMMKKDKGKILIFGMDHRKHEREIKNRIGYVGENHLFYGNKTVSWTGRFFSSFFDEWETNTFEKYLNDFAISRTKKTGDLSKGQRAKLSLALALSHSADLAILDEPTAGMDPIVRREALEILSRFVENEQKSVIISSHITDDVTRIADFITYILDGRIRLSAPKDELLGRWKRIHFKKGTLDEATIRTLTCVKDHMFGSSGITDRFPELKERLNDGIAREDIKVENADLDDILLSLVEGESS